MSRTNTKNFDNISITKETPDTRSLFLIYFIYLYALQLYYPCAVYGGNAWKLFEQLTRLPSKYYEISDVSNF